MVIITSAAIQLDACFSLECIFNNVFTWCALFFCTSFRYRTYDEMFPNSTLTCTFLERLGVIMCIVLLYTFFFSVSYIYDENEMFPNSKYTYCDKPYSEESDWGGKI